MADLPFFLIFLVILWSIGGPLVLVPIGALILLKQTTFLLVFNGVTVLGGSLLFFLMTRLGSDKPFFSLPFAGRLSLGKPGPRKSFNRLQGGGVIAGQWRRA